MTSGPDLIALAAALRGVLPTDALSFDASDENAVEAYPAVDVLRASSAEPPAAALLERLRTFALDMGGAVVLESAPIDLKRALGVRGEPRGDFAPMQLLKEQFRPSARAQPRPLRGWYLTRVLD